MNKDFIPPVKAHAFESISDEAMYEIKDEQNSDLVPHEFVDKEETSRLIMEIINKLSEEKRLVILMYYYQEMSTTEIAETLEMPLATVKYKLLVARREIKEELEKLDRNGTRLHAALPLTVLTSVFSKAAQDINVPAFSAISQSVLGAPTAVGATAGTAALNAARTAGIDTAKTRGINTIFKTTMAKVIAAVLALAVVGCCMTATGCNNKNNDNYSQAVNAKDESSYNDFEDSENYSSNLSEESKMSEIPETSASNFEYTVENGEVTITRYIGSEAQVRIPEKIEDKPVTKIDSAAFSGCESLTSVDIPDTVTEIGDQVFLNCTSLTDINASSDNPLYSSQDGVLFNKDKTTLICYPAGKENTSYSIPNSVTYISDYSFSNCTSLTSIDIPNSVTEIGYKAFGYCNNLKSVTIPSCVTIIDNYAFDGCESLTSIDIPDSVTKIGEYAFDYCKSLTSVDIPNSVTEIGEYAFCYCKSLTSIEIPDSVTKIGEGAFFYCDSLKSITIPNSVTTIGKYAFQFCTGLTSVTIPASVTEIGDYAFGYTYKYINYNNNYNKISCFTIYGKAGSAAEAYANDNGFKFVTD